MVEDEKIAQGLDLEGTIRYPYGFWDRVNEIMVIQHGHARDSGAWRRLYNSLKTKPTRKSEVDIKSLEVAILKHRGATNEIPWKKITEDTSFSTLFGLSPRVLGDTWASEQESRAGLFNVKRART